MDPRLLALIEAAGGGSTAGKVVGSSGPLDEMIQELLGGGRGTMAGAVHRPQLGALQYATGGPQVNVKTPTDVSGAMPGMEFKRSLLRTRDRGGKSIPEELRTDDR